MMRMQQCGTDNRSVAGSDTPQSLRISGSLVFQNHAKKLHEGCQCVALYSLPLPMRLQAFKPHTIIGSKPSSHEISGIACVVLVAVDPALQAELAPDGQSLLDEVLASCRASQPEPGTTLSVYNLCSVIFACTTRQHQSAVKFLDRVVR